MTNQKVIELIRSGVIYGYNYTEKNIRVVISQNAKEGAGVSKRPLDEDAISWLERNLPHRIIGSDVQFTLYFF